MLQSIYRTNLSLLTDFYQLTMTYGYWKAGLKDRDAVFHLFFRKPPFQGGYTVAAGLEAVVDFLKGFCYTDEDLSYLASLTLPNGTPRFEKAFLEYLKNLRFTCDIDAVPEGTVVFPYEPLIRVKGPLLQAQLLESPLLNLVNFPTLVATKASRICIAAGEDPVLEFGLRRAQGIDGAITASRSSFIGGCVSSSNVLAGKLFGIPQGGTQAHSWIMVFQEELESFQAYAEAMPDNSIFLVDTYNTLDGVKNAIVVGKWLRSQGKELIAVRLDSGDLAYLSRQSRFLLDEAGFYETKIVASNELDEHLIADLKRQGAAIDIWAVGTNLVTAKDQPALDGVYKLSAVQDLPGKWSYKLKLSEQMIKISNPGILQVRRYHKSGHNVMDAIYNLDDDLSQGCVLVDPMDVTKQRKISKDLSYTDLLEPIFRNGECVYTIPKLSDIQKRTKEQLQGFPEGVKRFFNPHQYAVGMEENLYHLKIDLIRGIRRKHCDT